MKVEDISDRELRRLESLAAEELIGWAFKCFGARCAIGTSLQLTGTVIIDMAARLFNDFRVFTVDTLRLHPETYDTVRRIEDVYNIKIDVYKPDEEDVRNMVERFTEYLFFIDKAKQEHCCNIRKVRPNRKALATIDVWITGLRRDQSEYRGNVPRVSIINQAGRNILRLCPVVSWTEDEIRSYIEKNNLYYNPLFDRGYDSVSCVICSTPLLKGETPRSGRWRWFNMLHDKDKKECGIHIGTLSDP